MNVYHKDTSVLKFCPHHIKLLVWCGITLMSALFCKCFRVIFVQVASTSALHNTTQIIIFSLYCVELIMYLVTFVLFSLALIFRLYTTDAERIAVLVRKAICLSKYGNPLSLKEGELLPDIKCFVLDSNRFVLRISSNSSTIEDLEKLGSFISSTLDGKYKNYAVTITDIPISLNYITFTLEDVTLHREVVVDSVKGLYQADRTKLIIQDGTYIDLTTSGSILVAGKTRSGKTTGIISILIQVLMHKRDNYHSDVVIIDPKRAELSQLPHTVTVDDDGEGTAILEAVRQFSDNITKRQQILNECSKQKGDAVKWWDANMNVSLLFIDEYVACRTLFPKRADKDSPNYSLAEFDNLIKRIVTMGASAGCYVIISIAEASVEEGGLPSMLKHAMSTKILFRPTLQEARLMWDSKKLENFHERTYISGDAWFSSTDGIHDDVNFVHFPVMRFPVYKELGNLLRDYYQ